MNALKVCAVLVLAVASTALWKSCGSDGRLGKVVSELAGKAKAGDGSSGFIAIPMPDGMSSRGVVIFAPRNCPSDAARRAQALGEYLSTRNIAYVRTDAANYDNLASQDEVSSVMSVMNGPIPVVYVNGKAKSNPTPQEVEAEYRGSRPG